MPAKVPSIPPTIDPVELVPLVLDKSEAEAAGAETEAKAVLLEEVVKYTSLEVGRGVAVLDVLVVVCDAS